jgi:tetratricopeptide (TPR) repeat protein
VAHVGASTDVEVAASAHLSAVEAAAQAASTEATRRAELAAFETELREACWRDFGWFKAHALENEVVPVLAARDLDPFVSPPEEVVARIQASPLAEWIVRALDVWRVRRIGSKGDRAPLDAVLAKADPDPVRTRIRTLLANREDAGLKALAEEAEELPGPTLSLLCDALRHLSARDDALAVGRVRHAMDPTDSDATFRLAQRLMNVRPIRIDEAMRLFAEVRRQYPESGAVHHAIGWSELMRGNLADGVAELRKAHRLAPDVGAFRQLLVSNLTAVGTAHFNQGQYADAASVYRECAELAPEQARIHARLAQALIQVGRPGALNEARQAAERATELAPQDALTHGALAQVLRRTDELEEALAAVDEARRLDRANGEYQWERGHILGRMGRVEEAVDALEAADGMSERAARFTLAFLLFRLGSWEGAEAAVRHAMRLAPRKQVQIRYLLIRIQAAAGDRDGLRDTGEGLLELERSQEGMAGFRPKLLIHQRIGGVAAWLWPAGEAKAWHDKTFPKCPPPHRAAFLCGLANERWLITADTDEALALLDGAHALAPSYAEAWLERGGVLQECGRLDEAMHAYAKAKQHGSHLFYPAIAWGKLLVRRGRWDEALALFRETHEAIGWGDDWIDRTERAKAIDARIDDIVAGTLAPTDVEEARLFAEVALAHERYALAARFLEEHLAAIPAEPPWESVRKRREALFLATECGFRAAAGEGEGHRSATERGGLRTRAMEQARELLALLEEAPRFVEDWADTRDLEYPRPLLVHPVYAPVRADPAFRARLQALWEKHR